MPATCFKILRSHRSLKLLPVTAFLHFHAKLVNVVQLRPNSCNLQSTMPTHMISKPWRSLRLPISLSQPTVYSIRFYSQSTQKTQSTLDHSDGNNTGAAEDVHNKPVYKSATSFPWLLSKEEPRIPSYPYPSAPTMWSLLNYLPTFAQREMSKYLGTRMLRLNTGFSYFPEQFLIGASLATRKALECLSEDLTKGNKESSEKLESIFSPTLLQKLRDTRYEMDPNLTINISIPQIYDATIKDVWITLGTPRAFENNRQYEVMQWMTLTVGVKAARQSEDEENFSDYRGRVAKGLMDGAHFKVDVEIDADVEYTVSTPKSQEVGSADILIHDRGRRPLIVSFETPYFEPADRMVAGRDEDDEPIMDWNWRIADIDQLLAKEALKEES